MKSTQIQSPLRKARPSQLLPAVFSLFLHFFHKFPMFALLMRALSPPLSRPLHWNNCLSQFIYDLLLLKCFAMPPYMLFHQLEMPTLYRRDLYADPHLPGSLPAYGAHGPRTKPHVGLRRTAPLVEYTHVQNHFRDDG